MKSYLKLVWAAICNREIANKIEAKEMVIRGPGAVIRNCRFTGPMEFGIKI